MNSRYELEIDRLALGLTKPATKCGVPLIPFYISILSCVFGWMFYQAVSGTTSLLSVISFVVLWVCIYACMLFITFKDPYGLTIAWININHFRKHASYKFWNNTDTFAS